MNTTFRRSLIAATLLCASVGPATAFAGARDELNRFTKDLKGLDGQFSQQVIDSKGKVKETTTGTVALSAPRQFRWEYIKPHEQLIIADGKTVWVYEKDLEQVTKRAQGAQEQNSPLTALINPKLLDQQYDVSEEAAPRDGLQWLSLSPKRETETSFQYAALGFNARGLARMEVTDAVNQRTVISFSGWKRNPTFKPGTFSFTPPKGTDVIGD